MPSFQPDDPDEPFVQQPIIFDFVPIDGAVKDEEVRPARAEPAPPMVIIHDEPEISSPSESATQRRRSLDSPTESRGDPAARTSEKHGKKRKSSPIEREPSRKRCKSGEKPSDKNQATAETEPQRRHQHQTNPAVTAHRQPRAPPSQKENQWQRNANPTSRKDVSEGLAAFLADRPEKEPLASNPAQCQSSSPDDAETQSPDNTSSQPPQRGRGRGRGRGSGTSRALHSDMMMPQRPSDTRPNRFMLNRPSGGQPAGAPPLPRRPQMPSPTEVRPKLSQSEPVKLLFRGHPAGRQGTRGRGRKKWTVSPIGSHSGSHRNQTSPGDGQRTPSPLAGLLMTSAAGDGEDEMERTDDVTPPPPRPPPTPLEEPG